LGSAGHYRNPWRRWIAALFASVILGSCSSVTGEGCPVPPRLVSEGANSAFAPLLSASIRHSRNSALHGGTHPLPEAVKERLADHFDEATLEAAEWSISHPRRLTLDTVVTGAFPRYGAMTFDRVIVFRDASQVDDISLWAHELVHVEQFRRMGGIPRFSRAYLEDWRTLEEEAIDRTNAILAELGSDRRQFHHRPPGDCA
jgi:hypothetical protein